ncbi:MAG: repeat containing exported protein [Myxococcaceae bacterium]|nr:repeat containing exported protein [Myxococcaceae bacterium]
MVCDGGFSVGSRARERAATRPPRKSIQPSKLRYTSVPMHCSPRLFITSGLLLGLSGCFGITADGKRMRSDVDSNTSRLDTVEKAQNAQLEQLKAAEEKAQESITQLQGVIEQATSVVQRNSADATEQVSELQTKVASLEGRLAELQNALEQQQKNPTAATSATSGGAVSGTQGSAGATVGQPDAAKTDDTPVDKNEHYAAAYRAYSARDFAKARSLFRSFISRYPTDAQADNAQYWLGASYLVENRPATALDELKKVIQNYRGGDAVDEALLDMAEAFYRLRACSDSRNALDTLIRTQPTSPLVSKAKAKLKELKKPDKDYCTS